MFLKETMHRSLLKLILLVSASFALANSAVASPVTYTLDPAHSFVQFSISHFDFSHPSGKWFANGTLVLDKDKPQNDKVNVTIDVAQMVTGNDELNKHLNAEAFFNTTKYPTATFVSTKVVQTGKNTANIMGDLTMRGVTKPIELKTKFNKEGISLVTNKDTVGFSATAKLKRSDFGITAFSPGLGDDVDLVIEVEASK